VDIKFNKGFSDKKEQSIQRIFVIGCMVYVSIGFAYQLTEIKVNDPFWLRFLVGTIGLMGLIMTRLSSHFQRYFSTVLLMTMFICNLHFYYLLYINDFDANFRISLLVVVITTIMFINSKRLHLVYNMFTVLAYSGLMIYNGRIDNDILLLGLLIFVVLLFGYMKNSDRMEAFRLVNENQILLNTVNNNIYNGIFRMNTNFRLLYANDYLARMLGYAVTEDRQIVEEIKRVFQSHQQINIRLEGLESIKDMEVSFLRKDGTEFWGLVNMSPIITEDDEVPYYDGTILDITDKKIAENELMLFSAAIDHTPTGVVMTDRYGKITYANPYFTKLTGYNIDEIQGTKIERYGVVSDPESAATWKHLISGSVWKGELNFRNKMGEVLTELTSVAPIRNEKGEIQNIVILTEDITERKHAEIATLEAKEKAEEATRAKEQFLSTMSHELRTPMNSVIGISNILLDESPRPDQVENLNILKFSAINLLAIINDILDLSKIEAGKMEFLKEDFDLHYTLINIKRAHAFRAEEKGIKILLQVDESLPNILKGDAHRLNQVLNNLVSNAVKFTEQGTVNLHVGIEEETEQNVRLKITVADTGIGIPSDKLEYIFQSFGQASAETAQKYGGTGLGLAITQKLVLLQGGAIQVSSKLGKGTTFTVGLTYERGNVLYRNEKPMLPAESSKLDNVRILLVDDNVINQKVAIKFLSRWKAQVTTANNGQEAIDKHLAGDYDLILMDLQMPVMDGLEATGLIRKMDEPVKASVPIIALTAAAMNQEREQAMRLGVNDYVCKPFVPEELYDKLVKFSLKAKEQRLILANAPKEDKVKKNS
jgi:PAS domain S-box-containing protein